MKLKLIPLFFIVSINSFSTNSELEHADRKEISSQSMDYLTVENIFLNDSHEDLKVFYQTKLQNITCYKIEIISRIFNVLSENAFCKNNPFSIDKINHLKTNYTLYLISSYSGKELCYRFMKIFNHHNYTMSHFKIYKVHPVSNAPMRVKPLSEAYFLSHGKHKICFIDFLSFSIDDFNKINKNMVHALRNNTNIVINLANNSGGLITVLKSFLSLLLPPNTVLGLEAKKNVVEKLYGQSSYHYDNKELFDNALQDSSLQSNFLRTSYNEDFNPEYQAKIAVIISPKSFSAAESCAKILRTHGATLIGKATTGYALISKNIVISGEVSPHTTALKLNFPVGELIFPDGDCLEGKGLVPDIDIDEFGVDECINKWLANEKNKFNLVEF